MKVQETVFLTAIFQSKTVFQTHLSARFSRRWLTARMPDASGDGHGTPPPESAPVAAGPADEPGGGARGSSASSSTRPVGLRPCSSFRLSSILQQRRARSVSQILSRSCTSKFLATGRVYQALDRRTEFLQAGT